MDSTIESRSTSSFDEVNPTPGLSNVPSTYTPGASVTFSLDYQDIKVELSLAPADAMHLYEHRRTFLALLARQAADSSDSDSSDKPISGAALAFKFLEYLLSRSSVLPDALARLFDVVRLRIMQHRDIHSFINSELPGGPAIRKAAMHTYVKLMDRLSYPLAPVPSALLSTASERKSSILLAFGGQSANNPACVDDLSEICTLFEPLVGELVTSLGELLLSLSQRDTETDNYYHGRAINLASWLTDESTRPCRDFIAGAAISFPITGITGLLHYYVICKMLGKTPGELAPLLGITGHSQGIVVAAVVAKSDSWESFLREARWAVELLFWMGYESIKDAPNSPLSPAAVNDSVQKGDGAPSHMLLVRGLHQQQLEDFIATSNRHLPEKEQVYLSLINGQQSFVVAGPPRCLRGLVLRLRETCASDDLDQSRVQYSKRKPIVNIQFLPVNAPFHSPYLQGAAERIRLRMSRSWPEATMTNELKSPVFDTVDGTDISRANAPNADLTQLLIKAVTTQIVNWPKALQVESAKRPSHIITLGAGRFSDMVHQIVDGYGIRVIDGARLDVGDSGIIGSKYEIFAQTLPSSLLSPKAWEQRFQPRIVRSSSPSPSSNGGDDDDQSAFMVETRLSLVIRAPPIFVAGMTPSTVAPDFVAAVTRAGYHIELAGGGYRTAEAMTMAIEKLAAQIPPGRGITCNIIYVDPKAVAFQIPLIRQLIRRGVPIDGLAIGAGIPSPDVATEYIQTLGLHHISFKPGSSRAIREVIQIARKHPEFPIILQWTGGRGGGHHSAEDFHAPILETYGEIRRCENIYLVLGSGFGDGKGMFTYLTGSWSLGFGKPAMPCDGFLLGSRLMVATDAHTSPGVKKLIIKAPGVDEIAWETSYERAEGEAGGSSVLTVTSEMGQPIHKLATRAVRFWKELDDTIFCLPLADRRVALLQRRGEIIRRLDADFAKPWFAHKATGPVDVKDMSYSEVLIRLVRLMYVQHQSRWIDPSYLDLVRDFATRSLERHASSNIIPDAQDWLIKPEEVVTKIIKQCSELDRQLLHPEDVLYFTQSCKKRGRKPVNFVVALDDDFEHWFKKDSLWQSEDLDSVIDQDPERVCILQSPVSVKYSTRDDQSAAEILDEIQGDLVALLKGAKKETDMVPVLDPNPWSAIDLSSSLTEGVSVSTTERHATLSLDASSPDSVSMETWIACLTPYASSAIQALVQQESLFEVGSRRRRSNPLRSMFGPRPGFSLILARNHQEAILSDDTTGDAMARVTVKAPQDIEVEILHKDAAGSAMLVLKLQYDEQRRQLIDCTQNRDGRIREFYAQLWLSDHSPEVSKGDSSCKFIGGETELTEKLQSSLQSVVSHSFTGAASSFSSGRKTTVMPLESAVIASWNVLMNPLLSGHIQGDILRLVHRSISIEYASNDTAPLHVGDIVTTESTIRAMAIESTGQSATVEARVLRQGCHVATVTSDFFLRGRFTDHNATFCHTDEPMIALKVATHIDEAVLRDREWLKLDDPATPLLGKKLVFMLQTHTQGASGASSSSSSSSSPSPSSTCARLQVRGTAMEELWNGNRRKVGSVLFDAPDSRGNPVLAFLRRKGTVLGAPVPLRNPGWGSAGDGPSSRVAITAPSHTDLYAQVSGDRNPIHASPLFAALAELPQDRPIMHGMYMAAVCRCVVEDLVCPGEAERLRRFRASFVGMVRPGDRLVVDLTHVAMRNGRMIFELIASLEASGEEAEQEVVLRGEAEVDQPATAYVFTGQGSQSKGMGMELYQSCPVARAIYDEMDKHLQDLYGWSILRIIKENPTKLTIHFRGPDGQRVLQNYLDMQTEVTTPQGERQSTPIIPDLKPDSTSYTFSEAKGLLNSTQFAQPAIILLEKATLEHMRANGLVQEGAIFAGHSLGEYGALSSLAGFVDFPDMLRIGFYRGLMMQFAIPRDIDGQTGYAMMAVSPGRLKNKLFDEDALRALVRHIGEESGELLEIVNFNIEEEQYVCAGHLRNLDCLTEIIDAISEKRISSGSLADFLSVSGQLPSQATTSTTALGSMVTQRLSQSPKLPPLRRGRATIPLSGIDVPFHSSALRSGIPTFRKFFNDRVRAVDIRPEQLVDRFVPNVVGRPFALDSSFIKEAAAVTQSPVLERMVC